MNPKSGKAGSAVQPADPEEAENAAVPEAGKAAAAKAGAPPAEAPPQKSAPVKKPHKPPPPNDESETKKAWIEIELVDEADAPVPGEKFEVELPDGTVAKGTLDGNGFARIDGIEPGNCKITFPDLDREAWEKA